MKELTTIFCLLMMTSCGTTRVPSLNLLEKEADYYEKAKLETELGNSEGPLLVPQRSKEKVTDIWVHAHEMPSGDYFRGGWVRTIIKHATWKMENQNSLIILNKNRSNKSKFKGKK